MNAASEIKVLRAELEATKKALADLQRALDSFFVDTLSRDHYTAWKRAKSGVTETPGDVTVGKNLPQAPTRTISNGVGIGGSAL